MKKIVYNVETEFGPIRVIADVPGSFEDQGGPASGWGIDAIQKKLEENFEAGLSIAVAAAQSVRKSVEKIAPDEVSVETGLTIEAGLWGLAKGEAAISITMTWKKP